jgi:hypothetical protein
VVEAPIVSVNKGGAKIRVEGVSGFIPFRRLGATRIKAGEEDMSYLVGQTVRAKIVEVRRWDGARCTGLVPDLTASSCCWLDCQLQQPQACTSDTGLAGSTAHALLRSTAPWHVLRQLMA